MRLVFAGNKERGVVCLDAVLAAGHDVAAVLAHPGGGVVAEAAARAGLPVLDPVDVNEAEVVDRLRALAPDAVALAGYSQILRDAVLAVAPRGSVNLHGGKLPQYRGSSPMNWALLNGEREITISAILVDAGVDTGDVLLEQTFPVGHDDTIADVQRTANELFPGLLVEALRVLEAGEARARPQDEREAVYWPLRFPDDGLVLFDQLTAEQVHNRVRALTDPYPGAFSFHRGRKVKLLHSRLADRDVRGEPGRVYLVREEGVLVCAADRCLWIDRAVTDDGADALATIERYDKLATTRDAVISALEAR